MLHVVQNGRRKIQQYVRFRKHQQSEFCYSSTRPSLDNVSCNVMRDTTTLQTDTARTQLGHSADKTIQMPNTSENAEIYLYSQSDPIQKRKLDALRKEWRPHEKKGRDPSNCF